MFKDTKTLHPLIWLVTPILWFTLQLAAEFLFSTDQILSFHREGGFHELTQFGIMTAAFILCIITLVKMERKKNIWLTAWIVLAALGCFYVAIEEISWGQSFFQWQTPDIFKEINNQGESNIHNTSRLFNHIPRYILMVGIVVGGLLLPLIHLINSKWLPHKFNIIYPPAILSITTITFVIITAGNKLSKMYLDTKMFTRSSEVEEIFMFFFVLLYIIIIKNRILSLSRN